jgi:hypothetical protein
MFAGLDMASAEFKAGGSLALQPGMEVAQIDWDGAANYVDWVTIEDVITDSGTPRLKLANFHTGCIWRLGFLERLPRVEQVVSGDHPRCKQWGGYAPIQRGGFEPDVGGGGGASCTGCE